MIDTVLTPARLALLRAFLRFGVAGGVGFLVDTAVVYGTRGAVGLYWAGALAYVAAATFNWLVNRLWAFRGRGGGPMHRQWALFLAVNLAGFVLNRGTYAVLVTVSAIAADNPVLAIAAGTAVGMGLNFHLTRTVVFR